MARRLHDLEDYLEAIAETANYPRWLRRLAHALSRTAGETGDLIAFR
jgi:hypothetical protein